MAKQKQAAEQPSATAGSAQDRTCGVALELLERLRILRLVYRAIEGVENILPNNQELAAARNQLRRMLGEVNSLHNRAHLLSGLLSRCVETGATALECVQSTTQTRELPGGTSRVKARRLS